MKKQKAESSGVEARDLVKRFEDATALAGISLHIQPGEFYSLLGPSGCGKTTLLRIIAGLEQPSSGELLLDGKDALSIPAHQRPVNTVFQSYALFPHLTVQENVAFGLRMKKIARAELKERVLKTMDLARISPLSRRKPAELSGGEKQRVALARALVNEPAILLLDEPLGALDLKLRQQLQSELRQLQRRLGITFLYVTHDQDEALALSDRISVLNGGRIEQTGTGRELYQRPANRFVAQFLGHCTLIEGTAPPGQEICSTPCGEIWLPARPSRSRVTLAIRPECVLLSDECGGVNCFEGAVVAACYNGAETRFVVETAGQHVQITQMNNHPDRAAPRIGERVYWRIPPEAIHLLED